MRVRGGRSGWVGCYTVSSAAKAIERGSTAFDSGRGVFDYKLRLGGQLQGERSLTIVRRGAGVRVRFWAALRMAYLVHIIYARLWLDTLRPVIRRQGGVRDFYARQSFLAQLLRRSRFRLFGGPKVQESRCVEPLPEGANGQPEGHR